MADFVMLLFQQMGKMFDTSIKYILTLYFKEYILKTKFCVQCYFNFS